MKAIVLAGGEGKRLWPLSRSSLPKQFAPIINDQLSLYQSTIQRLDYLKLNSVITICNVEHKFLVAEQLSELGKEQEVILEPFSRNTAASITVSSLCCNTDELLLILPSDHLIGDLELFSKSLTIAIPLASEGKLVTFGIQPKTPHDGYGYIQCGTKYKKGFVVDGFIEKPPLEEAANYIDHGNYLWNSGIFLFNPKTYLEEVKSICPEILKNSFASIRYGQKDGKFLTLDSRSFQKCKNISIDHAIFEKTQKAAVVKLESEWSDLGSWSAIWDTSKKDTNNNVCKGDVITEKTKNSYISAEDILVTALGVENLVIIQSSDALLVANKSKAQELKLVTDSLKSLERSELVNHRIVKRPWGSFDSVSKGDGYQVKKIIVNPGAKLSLQKHRHRSEHWVVVSGEATVTKGKETFLLKTNESVYIPKGSIHSLENSGNSQLVLIEVQLGTYLGEDDIVRLEDRYGRA